MGSRGRSGVGGGDMDVGVGVERVVLEVVSEVDGVEGGIGVSIVGMVMAGSGEGGGGSLDGISGCGIDIGLRDLGGG